MYKLVIIGLLISSILEVLADREPIVIEADWDLPNEQNNNVRHGPKPLSPKQIERLKAWKKGDQNMWELSGQNEGDMVLLPGQIGRLASHPEPTPLSPEQIERLASWQPGDHNMWEFSGQTEGDMVLLPQQKNGLIDQRYRWENKEIPYELSPVFSEEQANFIHNALKEFAAKSCVTVRPRKSTDVHWVNVTGEDTGCWSYVGRMGGIQQLNLQINGCLWNHTIVHEFLHAAGFLHQQSATERDEYVRIILDNVEKDKEHNFDKYDSIYITNFGTPYDYGSVMHYSEKAFSANGQVTIIPLNTSWIGLLGLAEKMSDIDAEKLNRMYCGSADNVFSGIGRLTIAITIFSVFYSMLG